MWTRRHIYGWWLGATLSFATGAMAQFVFKTNANDTLTITGFTGTVFSLEIPASIDDRTVAIIGEEAFQYQAGLESVTMADSVEIIEDRAFQGCSGMTSLALSTGLHRIGEAAFAECTSLPELTIPDSVQHVGEFALYYTPGMTSVWLGAGVTQLNRGTFYLSGLRSVQIPDGVQSVGEMAFIYNTQLTHAVLGAGVTSIGASAFANAAVTQMIVPDSVQRIGNDAFNNTWALERVTLGTGTTFIGQSAFGSTIGLTSIWVHPNNPAYTSENGVLFTKDMGRLVQYPAGATAIAFSVGAAVSNIAGHSFHRAQHLEELTIPGNVKRIGERAFASSSRLRSLDLAEGVESIGHYAFAWTGLERVELPASVSVLGDHAFHRTTYNTQFVVHVDNPAYSSVDGVLFDKSQTTLIQYPLAQTGAYVVPPGTVAIQPRSFQGAGHLTHVTIPDAVLELGESTFHSCTSLVRVALGSGITNLGNRAFAHCQSLVSIVIPGTVTRIGSQTFMDCTQLSHVVFASNQPITSPWAFEQATQATIYRHPDATGWPAPGETYIGRPVRVGLPPIATEGRIGMADGRFEFDLGWASLMSVVIEASPSPTGTWQAVWTSTPSMDAGIFTDASAPLHTQRVYRATWP